MTIEQFRLAYRAWLGQNVPDGWRQETGTSRTRTIEVGRWWMKTLQAGGYGAPSWPTAHGGMGATLAEQIVMTEEERRADAPPTSAFGIALNHAGTTLIHHGSPAQQAAHLGPILRGDQIWCQGFSEPDAGSDLASLQTRAVLDGDVYVVTGQKVWSSIASHADWCLLLVRTDPTAPKRNGITYLLLDLRTPGVEIRPLRQITGTAEFSEIFLDDVRVPVANRIGGENEGWGISQTTLAAERGPFFLPLIHRLRDHANRAIDTFARTETRPARAVLDDPVARDRLGGDIAEVEILAEVYSQVLDQQLRDGRAGPESSLIKLYYTEVLARLTGHVVESTGLACQIGTVQEPDDIDGSAWMLEHLHAWGMAIGGGTSDIQRNLIGERVLGLPREPRITRATAGKR